MRWMRREMLRRLTTAVTAMLRQKGPRKGRQWENRPSRQLVEPTSPSASSRLRGSLEASGAKVNRQMLLQALERGAWSAQPLDTTI